MPFTGWSLEPGKSLHHYNLRNWTRQNGLPVNAINAVAQTSDGFIWLGTHSGLIRFDGVEFNVVGLPAGHDLRGSIVTSLAPAPGGGLWFGLENSSYGFHDGRGEWSFGKEPGGTLDWDVNSVVLTDEGRLFVASLGKTSWRSERGEVRPVFDEEPETAPYNVAVAFADSKNRVWLGTVSQGVFYWEGERLVRVSDAALDEAIVCSIAEDREGRMWFGTTTGLLCYDAQLRPRRVDFHGNQVNALLLDSRGMLWIGTQGAGLGRWNGEEFAMLQNIDGLVGDSVLSLAEDREGSLWVGCREGLSQLADVKFETLTEREGMFGSTKLSVSASPRGGLWAACDDGITYFTDSGTHFGTETGLRDDYVKRVLEASDGDLYVISGRNEIEILAGGRAVARHATEDMPVAMTEDAQGVVVSVAGRLYRIGRDHFHPYPFKKENEPELYWILNLMTARDGSIWVASVNGICRIQGDQFQQWTQGDGLEDYRVQWICEDADGVIWAGLSTGIARLKDGKLNKIRREDGLFDANVHAMIPDDFGQLWVDSTRGLYRVSLKSLNDFADGLAARVECVGYDDANAVRSVDRYGQESSGCKTRDGLIWFPAGRGVLRIDPSNILSNGVPPLVSVRDFRADRVRIPLTNGIVIPPGKSELEFSYAALTFIAPQKVRYRYRLEGFDADWVDAVDRRTASYSNLKPGRYAFHVEARNADGVWSRTGGGIAIELMPHLYQTMAFKMVIGLAAVGGLGGLVGGRVRRFRKRQRQLERENEVLESRVQSRTRELAEQRNMLRTLIDHLPDNVFVKDTQSRVLLNNIAHARALGAATPEETVGKSDFDFFPEEFARKYVADEKAVIETGQPFDGEETSLNRATSQQRWTRTTKVPLRDSTGKIIGLAGINRDITERKEWEARLESMHRQLLDASRKAGMAEVASSVLHNVGNVLNSVNTSASVVLDRARGSRIAGLQRLSDLLAKHNGDLLSFLSEEGRARQIADYIKSLAEQLDAERQGVVTELTGLTKNIDHIKEIVMMQQSYARMSGLTETVDLTDLVEDGIRMNSGALTRHGVELVREFSPVPPITVEKNKVLQILVNLIRNAKYACDESGKEDKRMTIRLSHADGRARIEVSDNGVGILRENLNRIFNHGFTTRKDGHGFGLHSGAIAAKEMGGELRVHSDGPGLGATFILDLPLETQPS